MANTCTNGSSTVAVYPLAATELCFIVPSVAVAFDLPSEVSLPTLSKVPLVLPTRNHGLRRILECAVSDAGVALNIAYEVDTLELLKRIVIAGLACTVLAKPAVLDDLATATLVAHSILAPGIQIRLMLATAVHRPITRGIRLIEQEIRIVGGICG